jgi:FMN-dependent NADH-azoreductase
VITTRGGRYSGEPLDFQEPYLRAIFDFIGVTDISFIHAENLVMGVDERQYSIASAHKAIEQVIATWQRATVSSPTGKTLKSSNAFPAYV